MSDATNVGEVQNYNALPPVRVRYEIVIFFFINEQIFNAPRTFLMDRVQFLIKKYT